MAGMKAPHASTCQQIFFLLAWKNGLYSLKRPFFGLMPAMPAMPALLKNSFVKSGGDIQPPGRDFKPMTTLDFALKYLSAGVAPIPIWPDELKNPKLTSMKEYTAKLPARGDVIRWFKRWPDANIGLITGYWEYCALDFDDHAVFNAWSDQNWELSCPTWVVETARGFHVWFKVVGEIGPSMSYTLNGCEVLARCKGGYCIAPPSIHHTGAKYHTVLNAPPAEIDSIEDVLQGWSQKATKSATSPKLPIMPPTGENIRLENLIPIPQGAKPNARGAYQVFCPFHNDKRPSAWLNPTEQHFGCNACWPGLWWDVVNVYAMLHDIDNDEAYRIVKPGQK